MTSEEWNRICDFVTEEMRRHSRPFVTPLVEKTTLVGSGNYMLLNGETFIATCQHVAKCGQLDYRLYGLDKAFSSHGEWKMEPPPVDLAIAPLLYDQWGSLDHQAEGVSYDRFAQRHAPFDCYEILFFRGYAGENSCSLGIFSEANASAYSSQEKKESGNAEYFEIFWEPGKTQYTTATTNEERMKVKYENPKGFSGSFVWNTRYREITAAQRKWTPADAVVTGMAHRWDDASKTLLVYRVEHIREFISARLNAPP
jgi:hypothetical protein